MKPNHEPTQYRAARPTRGSGSFSASQILILLIVAILGSAALILAAFLLLSPAPMDSGQAARLPSLSLTATPSAGQSPTPPTPQAANTNQPLVVPAGCAQANSGLQEGSVRQVIDAETLEVLIGGKTARVKFAGLRIHADSPQALEWLKAQLAGQPVLLARDQTDQDPNGLLPRYVFSAGRFINEELVRLGYAEAARDAPDHACAKQLLLSEQMARQDHLGIWQVTPVPTATFMPFVTLDANQQACDCSKRYECSDFQTHAQAQACFNACNDYNSKLDDDRDGIACENLP